MSKVALITGITGQDGSYLTELLLSKGYAVHGIVRRVALEDETHRLWRIRKILNDVTLHAGSLESYASLFNIILKIKPHEVYHLAAQSYVGYSFEDEFSTFSMNINGTHYMLSAVKELMDSKVRFYFAASSEMFGRVKESPQNENTPFHPRSAYGISKVTGYHLVKNYREAYNLHASNGILFNHESPRRGFEFVTRKISCSAAKLKKGSKEKLKLGNINAKRDWGHAKDYVEMQWKILQQKKPEDYVIASGETHTVREFINTAGKLLNMKIYWTGKGLKEIGYIYEDGRKRTIIKIDKKYFRPNEVDYLKGSSKKAYKKLNFKPKYSFINLVRDMIDEDLLLAQEELNNKY